jgi:hypothetical protein
MAATSHRPQPDTPLADIIAYYNANFDTIDDQDRTKIVNNAGIPQILFGYQKEGFGSLDYGLKVSKINPATNAPYDVTTATNDQLYYSSAFNTFKIIQSGTATVTLGSTLDQGEAGFYIATTTVAHGLGHIPAYVGYLRGLDSGGSPRDVINILPYYFINILSGVEYVIEVIATMEVDATNITFTVRADDSAFQGAYNFQYYLLQEIAGT